MPQLWWLKTVSFFDIWSIEHFMTGIMLAFFAGIIFEKAFSWERESLSLKRKITFLMVLAMSFYWEILEHYLETWLWWGAVQYWMQWVEHWSNRLISDHLMVMSGWFVYQRFIDQKHPKLIRWVQVFSATWLFLHVFVFPHSMYLQNILDSMW